MQPDFLKRLGQTVRAIRQQQGLTTADVAQRISVPGEKFRDSNISRFERGEQGISIDRLVKLAEELGYSLSHLIIMAERIDVDPAKIPAVAPPSPIANLLKRLETSFSKADLTSSDRKAVIALLEAQIHWLDSKL